MSSIVSYSPDFKGILEAHLPISLNSKTKKNNKTPESYKVSIFVDKTSIEVFINDGESVITSLIFPSDFYKNISFSRVGGDVTISNFAINGFNYNVAELTLSWMKWVEGTTQRN